MVSTANQTNVDSCSPEVAWHPEMAPHKALRGREVLGALRVVDEAARRRALLRGVEVRDLHLAVVVKTVLGSHFGVGAPPILEPI